MKICFLLNVDNILTFSLIEQTNSNPFDYLNNVDTMAVVLKNT